jgi:predicted aspartyl protease
MLAASARLHALRAARRRIRRAVALGAVCLFLASWLVIFTVLISGHDPVLARVARAAPTKTGSASAQASTQSQSTNHSETGEQVNTSQTSSVEASSAPMTTRQS